MRRLALLLLPALAGAQEARVGGERQDGAVVLGRACLDLDRDGRCGPGEPGIAGARVRSADGRFAIADGRGRYHLLGLEGRVLAHGRPGYGAVGLALEGTPVRRQVDLASSGAAVADLPVEPPPETALRCTLDRNVPQAPTLEEGVLVWPVAGAATPGAQVVVDGRPAAVGPDGRFLGAARLSPGPNGIPVVVVDAVGGAAIHLVRLHLARPAGGAARVYPMGEELLLTAGLRRGAAGVLVSGRAAPGVAVRLVGGDQPAAAGGAFAAYQACAPRESSVRLEVAAGPDGPGLVVSLPLPPATASLEGQLLGDLELSAGPGGLRGAWRGAATAAGAWRGARFEAGLDLDDRDEGLASLARPRDQLVAGPVPDGVRPLVVAGDEAAGGDANPGRGRAWVRGEADGLAVAAGWTRAGLPGAGLGRYDRALFGARLDGEGALGPVRLSGGAFGAAGGDDAAGVPPPRAVHEVQQATGGSLFYLAGSGVVAGSLEARVEWRDPFSGLVRAVRPLRRDVDFWLDEGAGRLLLLRPLPSVAPPAALVAGDPFAAAEARLVLDYLDAGAGGAARLAGGRAGARLGPLELEVRGAAEEGRRERWRLGAAAGALALGPALDLRVEVARSEGRLYEAGTGFLRSADGGLSADAWTPGAAAATAVHAEGRGEALGATWRAWWRERPAGYSDGTYLEPRLARERGAELRRAAGPVDLSLSVAERVGTDDRDPTGATALDATRATARAAVPVGPVACTLELLHERLGGPAPGEQAAAGVRAAWTAGRGVRLEASHTQALLRSGEALAATFTAAGLALDVGGGTLGVRAGWGPDLGPRLLLSGAGPAAGGRIYGALGADPVAAGRGEATGSVLGAAARAGPLEVFTEEQVGEDRRGLRTGRVVGLAGAPAPGLRLTLTAERGERLLPGGVSRARGAAGAGAAWSGGAFSVSARGEIIDEAGQARLASSGLARWAPGDGLELSLRALAARGRLDGRRADDLDVTLGVAWRGTLLAVLATVAREVEVRPDALRRDGWRLAAATTLAVSSRLRAGAGAQLLVQEVGGVSDDRVVGSARVEVRVAGPFDVALEYARRAALGRRRLGDLDAVRAELGAALGPARLALGYALTGFTGDGLTPDDTAGRAFLRATLVL